MNFFDVIISIVVIGIIVSLMVHLPGHTNQNRHDANQMLVFSSVTTEVREVLYPLYGADEEEVEEVMPEKFSEIERQFAESHDAAIRIQGDIREVEEERFVRVIIRDRSIEQEYYFGLPEEEEHVEE